jgi:hypothetical protein
MPPGSFVLEKHESREVKISARAAGMEAKHVGAPTSSGDSEASVTSFHVDLPREEVADVLIGTWQKFP